MKRKAEGRSVHPVAVLARLSRARDTAATLEGSLDRLWRRATDQMESDLPPAVFRRVARRASGERKKIVAMQQEISRINRSLHVCSAQYRRITGLFLTSTF